MPSEPHHFLSSKEVAERIGVVDSALGYKLPAPDAAIGPINDDGSIPRGRGRR